MNEFPREDEIDAILLEVARALNSFNLVERALESLFGALADLHDIRGGAIMASIVSLEARVKVCDGMTIVAPLPQELDFLWRKLKAKTLDIQKKRHDLAHFLVMNKTVGGGSPVLGIEPYSSIGRMSLTGGNATHLTSTQIIDRRERFTELADALNWLAEEINTARGRPWPPPEFRTQEPRLVQDLRAKYNQSRAEP